MKMHEPDRLSSPGTETPEGEAWPKDPSQHFVSEFQLLLSRFSDGGWRVQGQAF